MAVKPADCPVAWKEPDTTPNGLVLLIRFMEAEREKMITPTTSIPVR